MLLTYTVGAPSARVTVTWMSALRCKLRKDQLKLSGEAILGTVVCPWGCDCSRPGTLAEFPALWRPHLSLGLPASCLMLGRLVHSRAPLQPLLRPHALTNQPWEETLRRHFSFAPPGFRPSRAAGCWPCEVCWEPGAAAGPLLPTQHFQIAVLYVTRWNQHTAICPSTNARQT